MPDFMENPANETFGDSGEMVDNAAIISGPLVTL